LGTIAVDKDRCTLCLSCVSACPASALQDNPQLPQLRFIEKNCVQCGLCASTCPEDAITLQPRLLLTPAARASARAQRSQPWACVRCGKPFGTVKAIEAMLGKLAGHAMFQGEALERLKMCGDCRVIDIYSPPTNQDDRPVSDSLLPDSGRQPPRWTRKPRAPSLWPAGRSCTMRRPRPNCWRPARGGDRSARGRRFS
jgi:NAD-dependent dihydropyrimidine dehydrogenase PreA subunit